MRVCHISPLARDPRPDPRTEELVVSMDTTLLAGDIASVSRFSLPALISSSSNVRPPPGSPEAAATTDGRRVRGRGREETTVS